MGLLKRIEAAREARGEAPLHPRLRGSLVANIVTSDGTVVPVVQSPFTQSALRGTLPAKEVRRG